MKKNKNAMSILLIIVAVIAIMCGLGLIKWLDFEKLRIDNILFGIGCALLGSGTSGILAKMRKKRHPEIERKIQIEQNDEHNISLRDKAQAKAYRSMVYIFCVLLIVFNIMKVERKAIVLLAFAYIFNICLSLFYNVRYQKEM